MWLDGRVDIAVADPYEFNLIDPLLCFRAGQSANTKTDGPCQDVAVGGERVAEKSDRGRNSEVMHVRKEHQTFSPNVACPSAVIRFRHPRVVR